MLRNMKQSETKTPKVIHDNINIGRARDGYLIQIHLILSNSYPFHLFHSNSYPKSWVIKTYIESQISCNSYMGPRTGIYIPIRGERFIPSKTERSASKQ